MNLLVIHEKDYTDNEQIVLGVADSLENAEAMMDEFYGKYEVIKFHDVRNIKVEYIKEILVEDIFGDKYMVEIKLEWFTLNQITSI